MILSVINERNVIVARSSLNSLVLLLAFCLTACSEPANGGKFEKGDRLYYEYTIPVSDSSAYYDISFCTRVDKLRSRQKSMELNVRWTSPSDSTYYETVWMQLGDMPGNVQLYRSGMRFPMNGDWILRIKAPNKPEGFCGMGVTWNKYYGTR